MKVAVWTEKFFPEVGGMEYAVYRLCAQLRDEGFGVDVITSTLFDGGEKGINIKHFERSQFLYESFNFLKHHKDDYVILYLSRVFQDQEKEHLRVLSELDFKGKVFIRIPTTFNINKVKADDHNMLNRQISFITLNKKSFKIAQKKYPVNDIIYVKNSIIPPEKFTMNFRSYFLFAGRITKSKNLYKLLQAYINYYYSVAVPIPLKIYGSAYDYLYYEECLKIIENCQGITYNGSYPPGDLSIIDKAFITIIPSFREGHSNLLIESLNTATPVIVSYIPGLADNVPSNYDFIITDPASEKDILANIVTAHELSAEQYNNLCSSTRKHALNTFFDITTKHDFVNNYLLPFIDQLNLSLLVIKPEASDKVEGVLLDLKIRGYEVLLEKSFDNWNSFIATFYTDFSKDQMSILQSTYTNNWTQTYWVVMLRNSEPTRERLNTDKGDYFGYQTENRSLRGKFGLDIKNNKVIQGKLVTYNGIHATRTRNEFLKTVVFLNSKQINKFLSVEISDLAKGIKSLSGQN